MSALGFRELRPKQSLCSRANLRRVCAKHLLVALSLSVALLVPTSLLASDPCGIGPQSWLERIEMEDARSAPNGIGGTGRADGIGGTGRNADGIGGTGRSEDAEVAAADGIGGTGRADGIGGTGHSLDGGGGEGNGIGGTGFVGTVTGFGSICVGGARITYDASTPVRIDGERATLRDLSVGQVVVVRAGQDARDWRAASVDVQHIVRGPVESYDADAGLIGILGQQVALQSGAEAGQRQVDALQVGDWISVSGERAPDGRIYASLVEAVEGAAGSERIALLRGLATRDKDGGLMVAGVAVHHGSQGPASSEGEEVVVRGTVLEGASVAMEANSVAASGLWTLRGQVSGVAVEGFVDQQAGAPRFSFAGRSLAGDLGRSQLIGVDRAALSQGARVRAFARFEAQGGISVAAVAPAPRIFTRAAIGGLGLPKPQGPRIDPGDSGKGADARGGGSSRDDAGKAKASSQNHTNGGDPRASVGGGKQSAGKTNARTPRSSGGARPSAGNRGRGGSRVPNARPPRNPRPPRPR